MLVSLNEIDPTYTIEISGDESWLSPIYENFATEQPAPKLTGKLTLENIADGNAVRATGKLSYAPVVSCHRCDEPLIWPLELPLNNYFQPEPAEVAKTSTLTSNQLDQYFYKNNSEIDILEYLNDQVHMGLPSRMTCEMQSGKLCLPELDRDPDSSTERENPFGVLAKLKDENH